MVTINNGSAIMATGIRKTGYLEIVLEIPEYEHTSKLAFWVLLVLILAFVYKTFRAIDDTILARQGPPGYSIIYTRWLAPHLFQSRLRQFAVLVVYLGILGLEILEGWWVLQTIWRFLQSTYDVVFNYGWAFPWYSTGISCLGGIVFVVIGIVATVVGCFIILLQAFCIHELVILAIVGPSALEVAKETMGTE